MKRVLVLGMAVLFAWGATACTPANSSHTKTSVNESDIKRYFDKEYGVVCYKWGISERISCVKVTNGEKDKKNESK